ncbi:hypothetical protein [Serinicoccus sp. CUA-874]|uniref:hypothetical protein n=1 Tax=Serinicoccus sp. CUA-874 TaxID=1517939 RepID=UPI001EDB1D35|nr:hypothetical protein [Serinicoccus sp. CUA-874]
MTRAMKVKIVPRPSARSDSSRPRVGTQGMDQVGVPPAMTCVAAGQYAAAAAR